ncbi:MAG: T9SS type A sorting domain-containing protein [Ignavibacteria bacterium]|nr:T9SS type A sorting domain-containing protein [Ignavibacteria bacterium]MBT8382247.1 T9SS type A sorting domain-containing protein [Ignavibacteria bacterium]MBT8390749.1 T9SS type A sorting domain-containing protein [Ignavibacteria bacterium]NNJ53418.1 T9SS type A sorting domain-containing protein [Ignavibacteriaceae bacterium]NNL22407.1 T9SS type A sorting domain-containing protein [Ignavibacteriaceae bacterium]
MDNSTGNYQIWSAKVDISTVDVEKDNELPKEFSLNQNYPNPFNPSTIISWQTPTGSWNTLKIYDALGGEVVTLVNEYRPAGKYKVEFSSQFIPDLKSGIYFYQLTAGEYAETKKMILLR